MQPFGKSACPFTKIFHFLPDRLQSVRLHQLTHLFFLVSHPVLNSGMQACGKVIGKHAHFIDVGGCQNSGLGGRGSAGVGHKIGNTEIYLVSHGADGRYGAAVQRPSHGFFVKGPEVFQRAASAPHNQ